jgi:hypothetical protein
MSGRGGGSLLSALLVSNRPTKNMRITPLRMATALLFAFSTLVVAVGPASADHPGFRPSYAGQYISVSTGVGTECWVAEWTSWGGYQWLYWNPVPCPDYGGDEVADARFTHGYVPDGGFILHTGSRIERFRSGNVSTGMDLGLTYYGSPYALGAGWFASASELWVLNGSSWTQCRPIQGWNFNPWNGQDTHVVTWHWGFAPCGQGKTYASWSGGYRWTGGAWSGTWGWSQLFVPCVWCLTASGEEPPTPDLPKLQAKKPPSRPPKA